MKRDKDTYLFAIALCGLVGMLLNVDALHNFLNAPYNFVLVRATVLQLALWFMLMVLLASGLYICAEVTPARITKVVKTGVIKQWAARVLLAAFVAPLALAALWVARQTILHMPADERAAFRQTVTTCLAIMTCLYAAFMITDYVKRTLQALRRVRAFISRRVP
jgi:Na+-driven multidrug efflux pump